MNFGEAFGGLMPGARGAVLAALLRTGAPLTGRRVHALVGDRHSLGAVQQALRDLEQIGIITTETVGRAGVHRINDHHDAVAPLRLLASPLAMLTHVVTETASGVDAVILFGSAARGEAQADSDIDLAVVGPEDWDGRVALADSVRTRLGNNCDVLHLTPEQFSQDAATREPVVAEILRDGVALLGRLPRPSRAAS
ncbi:nucleotidyltransferase domain-containing protein [Nocardioides sp. YIM 152315]|uniref:nucleotidyltransferase family protein n=1 Tax=Nocardioides sp. YIM 152315 TaxID=3031760 RepID=UPI0023DA3484|nr:nucleotidyltransferase domain-containing protein [Nocardioides sp. YIM 152315]MDF1605465.1 nucleotidyltransferase domain-containing protein [Nocardioides sp. YIM 152315]